MTLPWLVVGLYVVFWASEWPRRAFSAEGCPLSPAQMVDPRERLWSWLYYPLVFVFGFALLLSGWFLTRKLAPELLVVFLSPIIPLGAIGIAIGSFEMATGLSPAQFYFSGNWGDQRFYLGRARAVKVGFLRLASCLIAIILVFMAARYYFIE